MSNLKLVNLTWILIFSFAMVTTSCSSDDDNTNGNPPDDPAGSCYVELFDGDNFKDDHFVLEGEGEYPNLDNLPGADGKNWTDEADSFKVGPSTTMTVWTQTNFEGDSTVYEAGDYPSEEEPYSLKIRCDDNN